MPKDDLLDELDAVLSKQRKPGGTASKTKDAIDEDDEEMLFIDDEEDDPDEPDDHGKDEEDSGFYSSPISDISGKKLMDVKGTSIVLVPVLIDDSGSMKDDQKGPALFSGIELMDQGLKDAAKKGKDICLVLMGFFGYYYYGDILKFDSKRAISKIFLQYSRTPLTSSAISLAESINRLIERFHKKGINSHVSMLILTDGEQNEGVQPERFTEVVKKNRHWRIYGKGISGQGFSNEEIDDQFKRMGIKMSMPVKIEELAQAMFEFSQSASAFV